MERTKKIVTMEWIKLEDQKPIDGEMVQVYEPVNIEMDAEIIAFIAKCPDVRLDGVGAAFYSKEFGFFLPDTDINGPNIFTDITHWKPLDKPPTK